MKIDPKTWTALRESLAGDDEELFEQTVTNFVHQALRDERAARAVAERARCGGEPYFCFQR